MKILSLITLIFLWLPEQRPINPVSELSQTDEVESVVRALFKAMLDADSATVSASFTDGATLHTVTGSGSDADLRETSIQQFVQTVGNAEPDYLDEQLSSFRSFTDGDLATAWMEYRFYAGGEFSHCGVNTMNLIRKQEGWKIFSIVDTRRTKGC